MRIGTWVPGLVAPGVLVLPVLLLFWGPLFEDKRLYWQDLLLQFYPWYSFAARTIKQGAAPFWNPYLFAGVPLLGNPLVGLFYPPNLIFLVLPVDRAAAWSIAGHVLLAGWGTYRFAREHRCTPVPALLAGIAFMFSGRVIALTSHLSMIHALSWCPIILLLTHRLITASSWKPCLWLTAAITMQILAAHPQTTLITGMAALGYGAVLMTVHHRAFPEVIRRLLAMAGCAAAALAISAVHWIPVVILVAHSPRLGSSPTNPLSFSLEWPHALSFLVPNLYGHPAAVYWGAWNYWEMAGYTGIITVALALGALVSGDRGTRAFSVLAAAGLVLALGGNTPVYSSLVRLVPGLGVFRVPARYLVIYAFAISMLAARALDRVGAPEREARHAINTVAWITAALLGLLPLLWWVGPARPGAIQQGLARTLGPAAPAAFLPPARAAVWVGMMLATTALLIFLLLLLLLAGGKLRAPVFNVAILLLVTADMLLFAAPMLPLARRLAPLETPSEIESIVLRGPPGRRVFMMEDLIRDAEDTLGSRAFGPPGHAYVAGAKARLAPNLAMILGYSSALGYDQLPLDSYARYISRVLDELRETHTSKLLDFLAAGYVVSAKPLPAPYRLLYRSPTVNLYDNPRALPRASLVTRAVVADRGFMLAYMRSPAFDPRTTVVLEEIPPEPAGVRIPGISQQVSERVLSTNLIVFRVRTPGPAWLVVSDAYYPGWRAQIDGKPVRILRANYAFRAVIVEPGDHEVAFTYWPAGLWVAALVSGLGLAVWGGLAWRLSATPRGV
ncbi:MAG: YfhO family protein [Armatimonadetes bacterium]|nr:YfhO family protein [Armatimonadota bacterium]